MPHADERGEFGRVVASFGRHVLVETRDHATIPCTLAARRLEVVCGDEVRWETSDTAGRGVVLDRLPRRSALSRVTTTGRSEAVVANVSQLLVLFAPEPAPDFFIVDRYIAAAELYGLKAIVVLNKSELTSPADQCHTELSVYQGIGYSVSVCSASTGAGVTELHSLLRSEVSVLLGQSGVGKSTLANCLLPGLDAETAALSRSTTEGQHVTSVSTLHHLPDGADLIDSPGVRDYAPEVELLADPAHAFREVAARATQCRFQDCRHLREPDCAVRSAVETGAITPRRYESYRRLLRLQQRLREARPRKSGKPREVSR
jgi:ribosome biogenesis GTPase